MLPRAGQWSLQAIVGRRVVSLRTLAVRARALPPLRLTDPFDVAVDAGGAVLATDAAHRVLRVGLDAGTVVAVDAAGAVRRVA